MLSQSWIGGEEMTRAWRKVWYAAGERIVVTKGRLATFDWIGAAERPGGDAPHSSQFVSAITPIRVAA